MTRKFVKRSKSSYYFVILVHILNVSTRELLTSPFNDIGDQTICTIPKPLKSTKLVPISMKIMDLINTTDNISSYNSTAESPLKSQLKSTKGLSQGEWSVG